eukprot:SAG11_NODE_474_length_9142_cov_6.507907_10_plen_84_part_00
MRTDCRARAVDDDVIDECREEDLEKTELRKFFTTWRPASEAVLEKANWHEVLDDTFGDWMKHKFEVFWLAWGVRLHHDNDVSH